MRTQSSKVLPSKPGVGQIIDLHASPAARDIFLSRFYLPLPALAPMWARRTEEGHTARRDRRLMPVSGWNARGTKIGIGSKTCVIVNSVSDS